MMTIGAAFVLVLFAVGAILYCLLLIGAAIDRVDDERD